jgi:inosine-uridine nucleoside N-ribohydrolase
VQIPVDPTTRTLLTPELIAKIGAADTPVARYVAKYAESFPLWDELGAAVWLDPTLITQTKRIAVDVDIDHGAGYGNTLGWPAGNGPGLGEQDVEVVFEVNVEKLNRLVVDLLTSRSAEK